MSAVVRMLFGLARAAVTALGRGLVDAFGRRPTLEAPLPWPAMPRAFVSPPPAPPPPAGGPYREPDLEARIERALADAREANQRLLDLIDELGRLRGPTAQPPTKPQHLAAPLSQPKPGSVAR